MKASMGKSAMSRASSKSPRSREMPLIFVVDDNPDVAELAETILSLAGYKVKRFCDPTATLKALRDSNPKPAVLVTDYDMGVMTGLELVQFSRVFHPNLKTLMFSGTVEGDVVLSHPVKVDKFLSKPFHASQLTALVNEFFRI